MFRHPSTSIHTPVRIGYEIRVIALLHLFTESCTVEIHLILSKQLKKERTRVSCGIIFSLRFKGAV